MPESLVQQALLEALARQAQRVPQELLVPESRAQQALLEALARPAQQAPRERYLIPLPATFILLLRRHWHLPDITPRCP